MANEINLLMKKVRSFSQQRNWTQFHHPKDLAIALVLEAAEVLEPFRFKTEFQKEELAKELADVLNLLLRLADVLEIDLVKWFELKMKENAKKYPVEKCFGKNLKYTDLKQSVGD